MYNRHTIPRDAFQIKNTVKSVRGLGDSGEKQVACPFSDTDLEINGFQYNQCPHCEYDRCKITHDVNPTMATPLHYECMNPECNWNQTEELPEELQ